MKGGKEQAQNWKLGLKEQLPRGLLVGVRQIEASSPAHEDSPEGTV